MRILHVTFLGIAAIISSSLADETIAERGSVQDLSADAAAMLRRIPGVEDVERSGPRRPTRRIVHLLDRHFVERQRFAADLRSQLNAPVFDEEIGRRFVKFLQDVEAIQQRQMAILRCLIENHGLRKVYMEGLAERDQIIFDAQVSAARSVADELEGFRKERGEILTAGDLSKEDQAYVDRVAALEQQHRFNLLRVVR